MDSYKWIYKQVKIIIRIWLRNKEHLRLASLLSPLIAILGIISLLEVSKNLLSYHKP